MFYQHMPLYLKLVYLLKQEYVLVHQMNREYKYTLGSDILGLTWALADLYIMAQTGPSVQKSALIQQLNTKFECLKLRLRLAAELKLMSPGQYADITTQTNEIGKMIGSWLKHG